MTLDYAGAGDLLETWVAARRSFDGDAWVGLFADDAELHPGPFGEPLVGHNAIRAWLLERSRIERDPDLTVERHWVSGDTVLAAWHASYDAAGGQVREAGFTTLEIGVGRRIERQRTWSERGGAGADRGR
jgi:ketosteroid isomerase-like protein